jgi:hypothetical protein
MTASMAEDRIDASPQSHKDKPETGIYDVVMILNGDG